jgi:hypothetical protein
MKCLHLGIPPPFIGLIEMRSQYIRSYFPLFLSRGYLYHVTITYRLAAGTIEYNCQIIEEVY